jgi:hypothetical protein
MQSLVGVRMEDDRLTRHKTAELGLSQDVLKIVCSNLLVVWAPTVYEEEEREEGREGGRKEGRGTGLKR